MLFYTAMHLTVPRDRQLFLDAEAVQSREVWRPRKTNSDEVEGGEKGVLLEERGGEAE